MTIGTALRTELEHRREHLQVDLAAARSDLDWHRRTVAADEERIARAEQLLADIERALTDEP